MCRSNAGAVTFFFSNLQKTEFTIKMFKVLVILSIFGAAFANVITPRGDDTPTSLINTTKQDEEYNPIYVPSQPETSLPMTQFTYPTYPDYSAYANQLVPAVPPRNAPSEISWASAIASSLVPLGSFVLSYGARAVVYAFQFVALLFIGVALTTSICTFTPFCSITFDGLGINKLQVKKQVEELARAYITPENVNAATLIVGRALDTFAEIQREAKNRKISEVERTIMNMKKNVKRRR